MLQSKGEPLKIDGSELPFSFFPIDESTLRVVNVQFASSPWPVMHRAASVALTGNERAEATAYLEQAEAFYDTARGRTPARPLLHYYAMLNAGKAVLLSRRFGQSLEKAQHGLIDLSAGIAVPERAKIEVARRHPKRPARIDIFRELVASLGYPSPSPGTLYTPSQLMAQVVIGHRLWREATQKPERFLVAERIRFMHDRSRRLIWLRIYLKRATMRSHGMSDRSLVTRAGLGSGFVVMADPDGDSDCLCLEQQTAEPYVADPAEKVMALVSSVRTHLWRIVSAVPGSAYRRYYLYLAPPGTTPVPQIVAAWALTYYLGSIVRYRPHRFRRLADGRYGPFVDEFVSVQTEQLLYLFASEICAREIARPAIV